MPLPIALDVPGKGAVSIVWSPPREAQWTFLYAPGAGSTIDDPFGVYASTALDRAKIRTLRFQFPYAEAKRSLPDRPPVLLATWRAAVAHARDEMASHGGGRLVIGGRSMGGRMASMLCAEGDGGVDALALFAYPLHPPKKPEQLRTRHLARIAEPTLFVSGTNDAFGTPDELASAARQVPRAELRFLDRADHSFAAPKSSGRTRDAIYDEAIGALVDWLATL